MSPLCFLRQINSSNNQGIIFFVLWRDEMFIFTPFHVPVSILFILSYLITRWAHELVTFDSVRMNLAIPETNTMIDSLMLEIHPKIYHIIVCSPTIGAYY